MRKKSNGKSRNSNERGKQEMGVGVGRHNMRKIKRRKGEDCGAPFESK